MCEVVFRVLAECPGHRDAQAKGAKPSEALALIGGGPMVAPPHVPGWMLPSGWESKALELETADCEDDAYDSLELLGANPGAEQVTRAWVSARRLVRNLWQLSRATEGRRERW